MQHLYMGQMVKLFAGDLGGLSEEDRAVYMAHFATCPECRERFEAQLIISAKELLG